MKNTTFQTPGLKLAASKSRGAADYGWLQARYSFSFASYFNPDKLGFGPLRVLNQDRIQAGGGFGTHGHEDMEIITFVQSGQLVHQDSMGNRGTLGAGEVQVMSAGSGVQHSEFNGSDQNGLELMQMWITPRTLGSQPRWEQRLSPPSERTGRFHKLVGPTEEARDGLLTIDQDARLFAAWLEQGQEAQLTVPAGRRAYIHLARGEAEFEGQAMDAGDALEVHPTDAPRTLRFTGDGADLVAWDLPA